MPVLTVSEKTSPQDGFSRKRRMRPPSSVMTTPNSSGLSTCWRISEATALFFPVVGERLVHVQVGQRVPGDDDERIIFEIFLGLLDAARRPQRRVFHRVDQIDAQFRPVAEVPLDLIGEIIEGDDDVCDAGALEQFDACAACTAC